MVTRAEAQAEKNYATVVKESAKAGDWKAAQFWLERRRREDWGPIVKQEVSGVNGGPIEIKTIEAVKPPNERPDGDN